MQRLINIIFGLMSIFCLFNFIFGIIYLSEQLLTMGFLSCGMLILLIFLDWF